MIGKGFFFAPRRVRRIRTIVILGKRGRLPQQRAAVKGFAVLSRRNPNHTPDPAYPDCAGDAED